MKLRAKVVDLVCANCGKAFQRYERQVKASQRAGHLKTYCSQLCSKAGLARFWRQMDENAWRKGRERRCHS